MCWHFRLLFQARKVLYGDRFLSLFSINEDDLLAALDGKTVAIVGNSRGLGNQTLGSSIDAHDVVVRLNDAPMRSQSSHGGRTDWIAVAKKISEKTLLDRAPKLLLWMPTKRKRLNWRMATFPKFYLNRPDRNRNLKAKLGAPPSVGCMAIDLVQRSNADKISLYGFDFFASRSLSGRRTADQVPHDFDAERKMVETLLASDRRFHPNL
jgi:hypothetical protein